MPDSTFAQPRAPLEFTVQSSGLGRATWWAVAVFAAARVALAVSGAFNLSPDEAYFWEWSRHPDFGYYDQGPMVAAIIRMSAYVFGPTELGVRAGAIALAAVTSLLLARLVLRLGGTRRAALLAVVAFNVTPLGQVNGFIMTYYLPQLWLWTRIALTLLDLRERPEARGTWLKLGVWLGLGGLTHHTFIWLAALAAAWTLWVPETRGAWRTRNPWLTGAVAALVALPYALWNATHDWVGVRHALGLVDTHAVPWKVLRWYVAGQVLVHSPVYFCSALVAAGVAARAAFTDSRPEARAGARLVALGTWPLFVYVGVLAWSGRAEANWTSAATVLMAAAWALRQDRAWSAQGRMPLTVPVALGVALLLGVAAQDVALAWRLGWLRATHPSSDPTHRLHGWRELGLAAYAERESLSAPGAPAVAVTVDDYAIPAELSFYAPDHRMTYCPPIGRRHHQYDFWPGAEPRLGGSAVWVSRQPIPEGSQERALFREWSAARTVDVVDRGSGVLRRRFYLYRCRGFTGPPRSTVAGY